VQVLAAYEDQRTKKSGFGPQIPNPQIFRRLPIRVQTRRKTLCAIPMSIQRPRHRSRIGHRATAVQPARFVLVMHRRHSMWFIFTPCPRGKSRPDVPRSADKPGHQRLDTSTDTPRLRRHVPRLALVETLAPLLDRQFCRPNFARTLLVGTAGRVRARGGSTSRRHISICSKAEPPIRAPKLTSARIHTQHHDRRFPCRSCNIQPRCLVLDLWAYNILYHCPFFHPASTRTRHIRPILAPTQHSADSPPRRGGNFRHYANDRRAHGQ